jgi:hypothetical protein
MTGLSADDREAIATSVARQLQPDAPAGRGEWLKTAGGAVGVIAGGVALVYVLGGFVVAVRLLLDGSSIAEASGVVGQLSREFLITAGLVLVVGVAALCGLIAGLIVGLFDRLLPRESQKEERAAKDARTEEHGDGPRSSGGATEPTSKRRARGWRWLTRFVDRVGADRAFVADDWPNLRSRLGKRQKLPTWVPLIGLALLFLVPAAAVQLGESDQSAAEYLSFGLALVVEYAAVLAGWYGLRHVVDGHGVRVLKRADRPLSQAERGTSAGLVWAAMALPAALIFACFVGFEDARVCLRGNLPPIEGRLVADTKDAVLLTVEIPEETVVRVPSSQIARLHYGESPDALPSCSKPVQRRD